MPTVSGMLASVDLGPTLLYFSIFGGSAGGRPEYTIWKNDDPAADTKARGKNTPGTMHQRFSVDVFGDVPGVRIEFTGGSSEFGFPVTFLPHIEYSYSPNEHGLLGDIAPGSAVVVEASADLIRTKVNGGAWVNTDLTDLKESWIDKQQKNNFWRMIRIFSVPIPPIVLDPELYVGDEGQYDGGVGPTVPVPAWSANNVRVYALGSESPPGFWTNFVLSSETP